MARYKKNKIVLEAWAPERVIAMVTKNASANLHVVGQFVADEAQAIAPVDSGNLRDNITYRVVREGKNYVCWVGVKRPAFHAALVELGTSGHSMKPKDGDAQPNMTDLADHFGKASNIQHPGTRAQPYLRPAVFGNAKKIVRIFQTGKR